MAMRRMKSAMKAMKRSMKAKKAASMKRRRSMKKKKVSRRCAIQRVWRGAADKTNGGLKKSDLMRNKYGRVVIRKASLRARKGKSGKWISSVMQARKALGIKGFHVVGGKTQAGQRLLSRARSFYKK